MPIWILELEDPESPYYAKAVFYFISLLNLFANFFGIGTWFLGTRELGP